jgi:regulator of sigma E protease
MMSQPPLWLILIAFLAALGPLVVFHELGHYWVGRLFGVGAEQFSIGFGREVAGWTDRRGTRWRVGWLPLGGYVKFVGDADPSSLEAAGTGAPSTARGHNFHDRPPWQRFLIILAGPLANFILAIAIFAAFFMAFGLPATSNEVSSVVPGSAAEQAGIRPDDKILSVADRATPTFEDLTRVVAMRPGERVSIEVERDRRPLLIEVTLGRTVERDRFGQEMELGRLGVLGSKRQYQEVSPLAAVPAATGYVATMTGAIVDGLWQIISGRRSVKEIGGPLRMAQIAGQQASLGLIDFVALIAFFSINLGFINLLPVPVLDGGHLVLTTIEAVRRKPVSERAMEWAFRGGLAFLLLLMVVATFNDLGFFGLWDRVGRLIG